MKFRFQIVNANAGVIDDIPESINEIITRLSLERTNLLRRNRTKTERLRLRRIHREILLNPSKTGDTVNTEHIDKILKEDAENNRSEIIRDDGEVKPSHISLEPDECCICLEVYDNGKKICENVHTICDECYRMLYVITTTCPLCRSPLLERDEGAPPPFPPPPSPRP